MTNELQEALCNITDKCQITLRSAAEWCIARVMLLSTGVAMPLANTLPKPHVRNSTPMSPEMQMFLEQLAERNNTSLRTVAEWCIQHTLVHDPLLSFISPKLRQALAAQLPPLWTPQADPVTVTHDGKVQVQIDGRPMTIPFPWRKNYKAWA